MQKSVYLTDYEGNIAFEWNPAIFGRICKQMKLNTQQDSTGNRRYTRYYPFPFECSAQFFENGQVKISGARSFDVMQQLFATQVVSVLLKRLSRQMITVTQELVVTRFTAKISLTYALDIKRLQKQIRKHFGGQYDEQSIQFPSEIHKLPGVTIILFEKEAKVFEAQLVEKLDSLKPYLQRSLAYYRIKIENQEKQMIQVKSDDQKMHASPVEEKEVDSKFKSPVEETQSI